MTPADRFSHWLHTARSNRFVRSSAGVGGLTIAELSLGLVTAILLARSLGAEGLGAYSLALAAVVLASLPVEFGLPTLVMREIAHHGEKTDTSQVKGMLVFAVTVIALMSGVVMLLAFVFADALILGLDVTEPAMLPVAIGLIPLSALVNTLGAALAGKQMVVIGNMAQKLVRPGAFAILLGAAFMAAPGWLTPMRAMALQVTATTVALAFGGFCFLSHFSGILRSGQARISWREWSVAMLRLGLANGVRLAQGQILLLITGVLSGAENAGLLRIAQRAAGLVGIGTSIVYVSSGPKIALLDAEGRPDILQRLLTLVARTSSASAGIVLVGFIFAGDWLLDTLFGPEFIAAYSAIIILGAAETLRAMFGPGIILMNMVRQEGTTAAGFALSLAASVAIAWALTPAYGVDGAAWGMFIGAIGMSVYIWQKARRNLMLDPAAFGRPVRADSVPDRKA